MSLANGIGRSIKKSKRKGKYLIFNYVFFGEKVKDREF